MELTDKELDILKTMLISDTYVITSIWDDMAPCLNIKATVREQDEKYIVVNEGIDITQHYEYPCHSLVQKDLLFTPIRFFLGGSTMFKLTPKGAEYLKENMEKLTAHEFTGDYLDQVEAETTKYSKENEFYANLVDGVTRKSLNIPKELTDKLDNLDLENFLFPSKVSLLQSMVIEYPISKRLEGYPDCFVSMGKYTRRMKEGSRIAITDFDDTSVLYLKNNMNEESSGKKYIELTVTDSEEQENVFLYSCKVQKVSPYLAINTQGVRETAALPDVQPNVDKHTIGVIYVDDPEEEEVVAEVNNEPSPAKEERDIINQTASALNKGLNVIS